MHSGNPLELPTNHDDSATHGDGVKLVRSLSQVKGLKEALQRDPQVCSNYHPSYVLKTFPALEATQNGNAIFTVPNTPIKCAGAPQKIMYLGEEIFRKVGWSSRF